MSGQFNADDDPVLADYPGLQSVAQFAQMVTSVPWFTALGAELDEREINIAEDYLIGLGFPDTEISLAESWDDAAAAAADLDWNDLAWEAEEQLRMALIAEACDRFDEEVVTLALNHVSNQAIEAIKAAVEASAQIDRIADGDLLQAAIGAAAQSCYQAALVLTAEHEDEERHPFAQKYRLFEHGRWPIGVVGGSFHLF